MAKRLEIKLGYVTRVAKPSSIDFKRLLSPLVRSVEEAIAIEAGLEQRADGNGEARIVLALTDVKESSESEAIYDFAVGEEVEDAVAQITAALAGVPDRRVVPDAARRLREGLNKAVRRGISVQLVNGVATPVFSTSNPPPAMAMYATRKVDSEIVVKLISSGGKRPSARVQVLGTDQYVTVRLPGATAARMMGNHLYNHAVLHGRGLWVVDPKQFFKPTRLLSFKVSTYRLLEPYRPADLFDRPSDATGGVLDEIDVTKSQDEMEEELS